MLGLQDSIRLGAPFGFPLRVNKLLLLWVGLYTVFGLASKSLGYVIWLPIVFASIYAHELGHAFVTRRLGGQVDGITLHVFGGLTYTKGIRSRRDSILVSAAGPAVSIALGLIALAVLTGNELPEGVGRTVLIALLFVNLIWGVFNLFPIFPLDGGNILLAAISRRMTPGRALQVSSGVSLAAIGVTAVVAIGLEAAGRLPLDLVFLVILLAFLGWTNVQRWRQAAMAGAAYSRVSRSLGLDRKPPPSSSPAPGAPLSEAEPPAVLMPMPTRRRRRSSAAASLRELAADELAMRKLLERGVDVGLGGLNPGQRRLLLFHRNMLEERLTRVGFDGLTSGERELLALHHDMEDRSPH